MSDLYLAQLVCPRCKGSLEAVCFAASGDRVQEGILLCHCCRAFYPIIASVPVMLVFPTRLHDAFRSRHASELNEYADFRTPFDQPRHGELEIQKTFTEEWETLGGDDLLWTFSHAELKEVHSCSFLKWAWRSRQPIRNVLNVGVGYGIESEIVQEVTGADVFAVDLNLALLTAAPRLRSHGHIFPVIASAFDLPFADRSFDLTYSVGALHHTHSTRQALEQLAARTRESGEMFVWLYAVEDILARPGLPGAARVCFHALQKAGRPVLSRSPGWLRNASMFCLAACLHPYFLATVKHRRQWSFKNTEHNLRDSFTPRYYHFHRFNEVAEWLENLGFEFELASASEFRRITGQQLDGIGMLCRRTPAGAAANHGPIAEAGANANCGNS